MLKAWYLGIPATTRWISTIMVLIWTVTFWYKEADGLCLAPVRVGSALYELLTSAHLWLLPFISLFSSTFLHLGFFHLLFNISTFLAYGIPLERKWGSLKLATNILLFGLYSNILHVLFAFLVYFIPMPYFMFELLVQTCSLGFSAVLFAFIALDCYNPHSDPNAPMTVWGLFPVPRKVYPWALLVLIQFLLPHVSFFGHVSGLIIGWLYAHDNAHLLHFPSNWINNLESSFIVSDWFSRIHGWIPHNMQSSTLPGDYSGDSNDLSFIQAVKLQYQQWFPPRPTLPASSSLQNASNSTSSASYTPMQAQSASMISSSSSVHSHPSPSMTSSSSSSAAENFVPFGGAGHTLGGR